MAAMPQYSPQGQYGMGMQGYQMAMPAPAPAFVEPSLASPPLVDTKLSVTPDRVEKLLEQAYSRLETLGYGIFAAGIV